MLVAGTYEFADDMCTGDHGGAGGAGAGSSQDNMCSDEGSSALCIDRSVTIEAEVAGSVVLDAKGARRVMYVFPDGRAVLFGLNITGGASDRVSFLPALNRP